MKNDLEINKITREEFFNLKEENVMFITNPGRMGDEDGSTFIIKDNDNFIAYRIDGWLYPNGEKDNYISLDEMYKQFPKWEEAWHNWNNEDYDGKYIYVYMGFGNGLCVDKSIYSKYEPYLKEEVKRIKEEENKLEEEPSMYYSVWKTAIQKMINKNK